MAGTRAPHGLPDLDAVLRSANPSKLEMRRGMPSPTRRVTTVLKNTLQNQNTTFRSVWMYARRTRAGMARAKDSDDRRRE